MRLIGEIRLKFAGNSAVALRTGVCFLELVFVSPVFHWLVDYISLKIFCSCLQGVDNKVAQNADGMSRGAG